ALLVACFSLNGDLLSQWRGYASNGLGYAIGFDPKILNKYLACLLKVEYDEEKQFQMIDLALRNILENYDLVQLLGSGLFDSPLMAIFKSLVGFKNPAFSEEQEVRAVMSLDRVPSGNNQLKLQYGFS